MAKAKHTNIKKHLLLNEICDEKRVQYKEIYGHGPFSVFPHQSDPGCYRSS